MKYLKEEDWRLFVLPNHKRDGIQFEKLVAKILELMFGPNTWVPTQKSWDGSKDFYWYFESSRKWAECKNYACPISLDVISPTLVMAQIMLVDELLFFSYSKINRQTKEKIILYAQSGKKKVYCYDDDALEQLILSMRTDLFPEFFPHLRTEDFSHVLLPPEIMHYVILDPILASSANIRTDSLHEDFPEQVNLYHIMGIHLCVANRNAVPLRLEVLMESDEANCESFRFEFLSDTSVNTSVKPFEQHIHTLFFRPASYAPQMQFPPILVRTQAEGGETVETSIHFRPFKCERIGECPVIGSSYQKLLRHFEAQILPRERFAALTVYGSSGTGKSRLLSECISRGLKAGYRIIHFTGYREPKKTKNPQPAAVIRELILAVYDIPDLVALDEAETAVFGEELTSSCGEFKKARVMIDRFCRVRTVKQLQKVPAKYYTALLDRLFSKKMLIIVDNVQFFDSISLAFFKTLLNCGFNRNRICRTKTAMAFNLDYMSPDSEEMALLTQLRRQTPPEDSRWIDGFSGTGEAIVFLRQLLTSAIDLDNVYLERIICHTGHAPFQIQQTVRWLIDKQLIEEAGIFCCIPDYQKFYRAIDSIPAEIDMLLNDRWQYFCEKYGGNCGEHEDALAVVSAIHVFEVVTQDDICLLQLSPKVADLLERHQFLQKQQVGSRLEFRFKHDLIEKFFCSHHSELSKICLENMTSLHVPDARLSPVQRHMYRLYCGAVRTEEEFLAFFRDLTVYQVPKKIAGEYYALFFDVLFEKAPLFSGGTLWLEKMLELCRRSRDEIDTQTALKRYRAVNNRVQSMGNALAQSVGYGNFLIYYCEALDESGDYQNALAFMRAFVEANRERLEKQGFPERRLLCELYNRLHVYCRHTQEEPLEDKEQQLWLTRSKQLCRKIGDAEMEYTNYSDEGYLYFISIRYKGIILPIWKTCIKIFESSSIPQRTLNYRRKQAQVALIEGRYEEAAGFCRTGLQYTINGKYAYEQLFFRHWFSTALAECLILADPQKHREDIEQALAEAEECGFLLNSPKKFYISQLRAILAFYQNSYDRLFALLRHADQDLKASRYRTHRRQLERQWSHNMVVMLRPLRARLGEYQKAELSFEMRRALGRAAAFSTDSEFFAWRDKNPADSMIQDPSEALNFPCP